MDIGANRLHPISKRVDIVSKEQVESLQVGDLLEDDRHVPLIYHRSKQYGTLETVQSNLAA